MAKETHERYLTKRDRNILRFVGHYRAATAQMIHSKFFQKSNLDNASRVLRRLVERRLLAKFKCGPELSYVMPTSLGLGVVGLEPRTPRPLTEQSLPVVLSITSYCVDAGLQRLTNQNFRQLYPELTKTGLQSSNYVLLDSDTGPKLELLTVDRGGTPRRIRGKVRRLVAQRKCLPAFESLMNSGRFQINVLVGTPEQQKRFSDCIKQQDFGRVAVKSTLVRELGDILMIGEFND